MAFLFKSKKNQQDRNLQSRESPNSSRVDKHGGSRATPTGSNHSIDDGTPSPDVAAEKYNATRRAPEPTQQQQQQPFQPVQQLPPQSQPPQQPPPQQPPASDLPFRNGPQAPPQQSSNSSLYPWSQRRINFNAGTQSPFPRYGAAVNSVSSKEGDIYVMGGLINSSTVKGDLWIIEAGGNMSSYPLGTTAEGPGPRVGHSSLLVGNAFIVYGGDTKIEETDVLDETLYLLNTSTRQWSRALPAGPRPSGRYGHSLNIVGSKIYIFGGQVEGVFMNDLAAFDLNQLQMPNNRWEVLMEHTDMTPQTQGQVPPARTNHSVVTYNDKMYLFGGTDGFHWFNDVWCYDPAVNKWGQLDCIGYIPVPREGHSAALVDDVMYIYGGRTEEGADLGDLAAFRITSRRWYTFQNMGPSPSPRSGHNMTAVGKSIVVVGGEPSSATNQVNDLSIAYILDTSKIRYPNDAQIQSNNSSKIQGVRRPSTEQTSSPAPSNRVPASRDGSNGPDPARVPGGPTSPTTRTNGVDMTGPPPVSNGISKLPRAAGTSTPSGPPPQQGPPPRPTVNTNTAMGRARNASIERIERDSARGASPTVGISAQSPVTKDEPPTVNGRRTPSQSSITNMAVGNPASSSVAKSTRQTRGQGSMDSNTEPSLKNAKDRPSSPPPPTRQTSNPLSRRGSNRNSQTVALLKELDSARNRNAWYASELELARKAGYSSSPTAGNALEARAAETFDDEDKPLIEALLAMKQELANVQGSVDKQAILAAKQIAEAEKQRDAAVREAVYAKAKMAAHVGSASSTPQLDADRDAEGGDRSAELNQKLASVLNIQKDLQNTVVRLNSDFDAEKRARLLSDETCDAAQKRVAALETYKQQASQELESLKGELHLAQRESREQSVMAAEATAALEILRIEKSDIESKYNDAQGQTSEHGETLDSLRDAVAASADMRQHLERKLEEERSQREKFESKLTKIKGEHEARTAELVAVSQRLRDAEELAERSAAEARTHRQAVLSGLEKITNDSGKASHADAERIAVLQAQVNAANALARKYQQEADAATDKLRSAEERIAGLEAYQEQSSREGVNIRRQLQSTMRETQSLQALNADLKQQLSSQQLEANAIAVQHTTLKDILSERGISPSGTSRSRGGAGGRNSPDVARIAALEQQLTQALADHESTKQGFSSHLQESEMQYRDKITQLENDYQSAVHYVKGTEKMLKRMKEELGKYKADNTRLKNENIELEDQVQASAANDGAGPDAWEKERTGLLSRIAILEEQVQGTSAQLERQLAEVRGELEAAKIQRDAASKSSEDMTERLSTRQKELEQMQQENVLLEKRAQEAETRVGSLLDQMENSVDNYRRQSRISGEGMNIATQAPSNTNGAGHVRQESSDAGSDYGGVGDNRNSQALDNLANELDMLRSHWEATNKNYRLSNTFDFEGTHAKKDDGAAGLHLTEDLADWRKRLDTDDQRQGGGDAK